MSFIVHYPSYPLNAYINSFYTPKYAMPYRREKVLPIPVIDLKINFGGAVRVYKGEQTEPIEICTESWCTGLSSEHHIIERPENSNFIGVSFKPGGAYPFLQIPLNDLHNQVVPLDAIWGRFACEIRERLYETPTVQARFALLEQFLLARLQNASDRLKAIRCALAEIETYHGAISVQALSEKIGFSDKHLTLLFNTTVGTTPKCLARLHRFYYVLKSIDPTKPINWAHLAQQYGYFDQSHFNREFKRFTGHSPTAYLQLRQQVAVERPEHSAHVRLLPTKDNMGETRRDLEAQFG